VVPVVEPFQPLVAGEASLAPVEVDPLGLALGQQVGESTVNGAEAQVR
jgi:hypothetical protein